MRLALVFALLTLSCPCAAGALDGTEPRLRYGFSAGIMGTLAADQSRTGKEFENALWVDLEVVQFDIGEYVAIVPFARFVVQGGVNTAAIGRALDATLRKDLMGKTLPPPSTTMIELGARARVFPFARRFGAVRPFGSFGLAYATAGATYGANKTTASSSPFGRVSTTQQFAHRHTGLAMVMGLGVRFDVPIRAFHTDMLAPVAIEAQYIKNFWLGLDRALSIETTPGSIGGRDISLDFVGLALTVGFLR